MPRPGIPRMVGAAAPPVLLAAMAVLLTMHAWRGFFYWSPDSVFYEAQTLELRGAAAPDARAQAIAIAFRAQRGPAPRQMRALESPRWVDRSAPNYRRRWLVPLLAAAAYPLFGTKSLLYVSLVGYVAAALLMYALARRRASRPAAFVAAAGVVYISRFDQWAVYPLTDSWGVATLAAALLAGSYVLDRGSKWLPLWSLAVLGVSFTRDAAVVACLGALGCTLLHRRRRDVLLFGSGVLAALPAPMLFGASLKDALAYQLSGTYPPDHVTWSYDLHRYWVSFSDLISSDVAAFITVPNGRAVAAIFVAGAFLLLTRRCGSRARRERRLAGIAGVAFAGLTAVLNAAMSDGAGPMLPIGVLVVSSIIVLYVIRRHDPVFAFQRWAAVGALASLAILPHYTHFRFELILLPATVVGTAALLDLARVTDVRVLPHP
jgi:hypothetical protein